MFRSRRSSLSRQLWKLKSSTEECNLAAKIKSSIHQILKSFDDDDLEQLVKAVDSSGTIQSDCVLAPVKGLRLGDELVSANWLFMKIWRVSELHNSVELKNLGYCSSGDDKPGYCCCNPYHWAVLQSTPDTYSTLKIKPDDLSSNLGYSSDCHGCAGFRSTECTGSVIWNDVDEAPWCRITYWEARERIGRLFTFSSPSVSLGNVTGSNTSAGICLTAMLASWNPSAKTASARSKIGRGIRLFREGPITWIYNWGSSPVFVNSTWLGESGPVRLPSDHTTPVFDLRASSDLRKALQISSLENKEGPQEVNSIIISLVKGWGRNYRRRFITDCPCWLEVILIA
uniref:Mothers against decapentaplegic homolog n=1 Tax=Meara stichopi TaxID=84115 RepID=A0A2P1DVD8_9BILA|nr:SMAD6 protein [Meara stichopi]